MGAYHALNRLYSTPNTAGTIESSRDASNKSGVITCSRVFGGTSGPETCTIRAVGKCFGWVTKINLLKFRSGKTVTMPDSHWLICLRFCLARTVLSGSGGDALGVSRKDARAEGSSAVCGLLRGVNHVVLVFVMRVVRLGLAVRACALRGTHGGLRVRVLHKECRGRDVLVGDVRGGT